MKIKLAALTLLCVAMICSESNADLLGRMLGKSGCGECEAAPTCCETPDPCCGRGISISLHIGLPGRLFNGCGCKPECEEQVEDACDDGCGGGRIKSMFAKVFNGCCKEDACEEPEPACEEADDCGCKLFSRGLFSRFCDNGCEEEPACEDACGCGMNLDLRGKVSGLVSRIGSMGCNTCCEEAPAAEPAPACEDACGCGMNLDLRGKVSGLVSRVGSMGCNSCCEEAPAAEPAPACEDACGCGMNLDLRGKVSGLVFTGWKHGMQLLWLRRSPCHRLRKRLRLCTTSGCQEHRCSHASPRSKLWLRRNSCLRRSLQGKLARSHSSGWKIAATTVAEFSQTLVALTAKLQTKKLLVKITPLTASRLIQDSSCLSEVNPCLL